MLIMHLIFVIRQLKKKERINKLIWFVLNTWQLFNLTAGPAFAKLLKIMDIKSKDVVNQTNFND
jgi:hypothetical protein